MAKGTEIDRAVRAGKEAIRLIERDGAQIGGRLAAGTLDRVRVDVALLEGAPPRTQGKRQAGKVATTSERQTASRAATFVARVRDSVVSANATATTRKAWGVGVPVRAPSTPSVLAALDNVIERGANVASLAPLGLSVADIDKARAYREALGGADATQRDTKREAATTTRERDQAIKRSLAAAQQVASAGALHFHGAAEEPDYDALAVLASVPSRRAKKPVPAPPAPPG